MSRNLTWWTALSINYNPCIAEFKIHAKKTSVSFYTNTNCCWYDGVYICTYLFMCEKPNISVKLSLWPLLVLILVTQPDPTVCINYMSPQTATVECRGPIQLGIAHITLVTESKQTSEFVYTTNPPNLALTNEVWGVYCEEFGENWPRYNGTALYL